MDSLKYDRFLDLRGLECPLPVVKAREEIGRMVVGQVLKVFATDRSSLRNFQGWAHAAKNIILTAQGIDSADGNEYFTHYILKIL
jgi:tRNA 2-thiouridine synthesizing protein A